MKYPQRMVSIDMTVEFGSKFQEEITIKTIELMIKALKIQVERQHKKNKIDYEIIYRSQQ